MRIGAYYMPGWKKGSRFWEDLKGGPKARSGLPWPERMPILGEFPEGEDWVTYTHVRWAKDYGLSFFIYDWFWLPGKGPHIDHALNSFLRIKMDFKFAIAWINHDNFAKSVHDWPKIAKLFAEKYFPHPNYLKIDDRPLVVVYDIDLFRREAKDVKRLFEQIEAITGPVFWVGGCNRPLTLGELCLMVIEGYGGLTAYNYVGKSGPQIDSYNNMIAFYDRVWKRHAEMLSGLNKWLSGEGVPEIDNLVSQYKHHPLAQRFVSLRSTGRCLRYMIPVSPGFDDRPCWGEKGYVRLGNTPERFKFHLEQALLVANLYPDAILPLVVVEAWNEFCEGSFIEPTVGWGFRYLEAVQEVASGTN